MRRENNRMPYQVQLISPMGLGLAPYPIRYDDSGRMWVDGDFPEDVQTFYAYEVTGPGVRLQVPTKNGLPHIVDKGSEAVILGVGPTRRGLEAEGFEWGETDEGAAWHTDIRDSVDRLKQAGMPFVVGRPCGECKEPYCVGVHTFAIEGKMVYLCDRCASRRMGLGEED